jgi:hypothetical protein
MLGKDGSVGGERHEVDRFERLGNIMQFIFDDDFFFGRTAAYAIFVGRDERRTRAVRRRSAPLHMGGPPSALALWQAQGRIA